MISPEIRVWVEEVEPPSLLRFTWKLTDEPEEVEYTSQHEVIAALMQTTGVERAVPEDEGLLVEIIASEINRYDVAAAIRTALAPPAECQESQPRARVWSEELAPTRLRLSWETETAPEAAVARAQRRRVAAHLLVEDGVQSASPDDGGVVVEYDSEVLERAMLGPVVRTALDQDGTLRERVDGLTKRATTYGNLGRKLALDDRISPIPGAAKQAASSRGARGMGGNAVSRTALRFVPGATLISRIQMLLPVLTELSKWSRESDPEIVEAHLQSVGLDRETLKSDTITAHEVRFYARDAAVETASTLGTESL